MISIGHLEQACDFAEVSSKAKVIETPADESPIVAYFSMEFGLDPAMPTYNGGLGVLAGDCLRAAADMDLPIVGVTLLHRKGYFRQHLDSEGNQTETEVAWPLEQFLHLVPPRVIVNVGGCSVQVQAWRYLVRSEFGHSVPVYFLDTAVPENSSWEQGLTAQLYQGNERYRLAQEAILGLGGVAMIRALGYHDVHTYHMNEGHSALITLALLEEQTSGREPSVADDAKIEAVRERCVFTTHTPVASGHDVFHINLVREILSAERTNTLAETGCLGGDMLNMTHLALRFSRYVNGVSMRHEAVCRDILNHSPVANSVTAISNGVHAGTWTCPAFQVLYDRCIPEWRRDNLYLRYAIGIPLDEIWRVHKVAKQELISEVERRTGIRLSPEVLTLGSARRATPYKRMDMLFSDLARLKRIAQEVGPFQIVCGGKAHPRDTAGKHLIRRIFEAANELKDIVPVVYLEEYDMGLGRYLCAGVDLWLNTPQKPQEASGTSGMKAALNGVPSLSVLDGWWIEGHVEGVTGWAIGDGWQNESNTDVETASLYDKLESIIVPTFYNRPDEYKSVMRSAISINGSYYNAQRMMTQYWQNAYLLRQNHLKS